MTRKNIWGVHDSRRCPKCKKTKPASDFHVCQTTPHGLSVYCKLCEAERMKQERRKRKENGKSLAYYRSRKPRLKHAILVKQFGITMLQYKALESAQGGVCAICRQPETVRSCKGATLDLAVDHDHSTGRVRGLLCGRCNFLLGLLENLPADAIRSATAYLSNPPANSLVMPQKD